jgi:hypothetical protein
MKVIDLLEKAFVGKVFGTGACFTFSRYSYLKKPPVIKSVALRGYEDETVSIKFEFEPDEDGNPINPYYADLDEEIQIL